MDTLDDRLLKLETITGELLVNDKIQQHTISQIQSDISELKCAVKSMDGSIQIMDKNNALILSQLQALGDWQKAERERKEGRTEHAVKIVIGTIAASIVSFCIGWLTSGKG